jgi:hypothetical protein
METIPFKIAKILKTRSKLDQRCELSLQGELQTSEERDQERLQKVERSSTHISW